jgi:YbbR domain-containing protein
VDGPPAADIRQQGKVVKPALRWIASNLPLALLALLLAVLTWVTAVEEADPTKTDRFLQPIPVEVDGLPAGLVIVGEVNAWTRVTLRAPESVWDALSVDDFSASIDLTGLGAGIHHVPINVTISAERSPSEIVLIEPQTITVELQRWAERTISVDVQLTGEPALAYSAQTMIITPTTVTISGPSTYVDQVVQASAEISIQDAEADVEETLALQALNADGQTVPFVTVTPVIVQVRVPIEIREDFRTLTVKPIREGLIEPGYTITGFSVDPESVTVSGAPAVIAALPGFIETEPISVEGAQADVIAHPPLNVPSNVALVPGQQVTVTYYIEAIHSSLTMEITPTLQNLASGLTATVSPTTVEVFLSGPLPQLEAMQVSDVRVVIELFELEPGTYQIAPQVVVPDGLTNYSILPSIVQVEITVAPTPTPTPRASRVETPTPTPTEN